MFSHFLLVHHSATIFFFFQERDRLLSFVVVGGGPNGVEFAAELHGITHTPLKQTVNHSPSLPPSLLHNRFCCE